MRHRINELEHFVCKKCESLVNVTHEILFYYKPKIRKGSIRIVAIGGDGTINEVVNGMVRVFTQDKDGPGNYPALVLIPAGMGNDTARGLRDLARQFRCTAAGERYSGE
ncbi:MAG: acylglycerol kinase family protein [Thermodesulfobacteriota bacterium]|nr:acylglycerol kinase family protein [Thermodesulfobacteriota bacterium]